MDFIKRLFQFDNQNYLQQFVMQEPFLLDGQTLTPSSLTYLIESNRPIALHPSVLPRLHRSREALQTMMAGDKVVYGINTGFGNFADVVISKEDRQKLQINLITSHSVGVGNPVDVGTVKRMLILRINTIAKGRSGLSLQNLQKLIAAYNSNYSPMIPCQGTVGASGDLAPLSHLALGMLGIGKAWDQEQNQFSDASEIMKRKGLTPISLQEKEGLALINGTQFMSAILCQVVETSQRIVDSAVFIIAMAVEMFGMRFDNFKEEVIAVYEKSSPGIAKMLKKVKNLLDQTPSQLHKHRMSLFASTQAPSSILSCINSLASSVSLLQFCTRLLTEEINGATDNPLIYLKQDGLSEDSLVSAGNFHGEYVAKAGDFVGMGLFNIGKYSQARIERYINGRISKLPPFLIKSGGLNSGFMIAQYTSASLISESKVLIHPSSVDSVPTSASQQDHVSMGGFAVRKAQTILNNVAQVLGIELLMALAAVDQSGQRKQSTKIQKIQKEIRKTIKPMDQDRYYGEDLQTAKKFVLTGLTSLL